MSHRIRFVYTPKHSSWLNQIEVVFGVIMRKVIRRGSFTSVPDLRDKLVNFIDYFNRVFAHRSARHPSDVSLPHRRHPTAFISPPCRVVSARAKTARHRRTFQPTTMGEHRSFVGKIVVAGSSEVVMQAIHEEW